MDNQVIQDGKVRVNVALQVAGIAAQVTAAIKSGSQERCQALESKLDQAQAQLDPQDSPPGLIAFIDIMRGMLLDQPVSARAGGLPPSYRAVYQQVVDSIQAERQEGDLTIRQVMDEVAENVVRAMQYGTPNQQQQMAEVLFRMEQESEERIYMEPLVGMLQAARILLEGGDPTEAVAELRGPFRAKWDEIMETLQG